MKSHLIAIVAAVVLVGCGPSAPDISIHDAARDGNIEAVKQHIAAGTDVNAKSKYGDTPLNYASARHKEIVKLLIANGADVNAKDSSGQTPLDNASGFNKPEIVAILRKHGGKSSGNFFGK